MAYQEPNVARQRQGTSIKTQGFFGRNAYATYTNYFDGGGKTAENDVLFAYAEMVGFSPATNRWYLLSILHGGMMLYFLGWGICYLIESLGQQFINQWWAMIIWSVLGGIFIFVLQGILYIMLQMSNKTKLENPRMEKTVSSYLGAAHMKEVFLAFIMSLVIYAIVFWVQLDWLERFHPGYVSNIIYPDPANVEDYLTFRMNNMLITILNFSGFIMMLRVFFTHLNPLTTLAGMFETVPGSGTSYETQGDGRGRPPVGEEEVYAQQRMYYHRP
jgi:hypothetical protein